MSAGSSSDGNSRGHARLATRVNRLGAALIDVAILWVPRHWLSSLCTSFFYDKVQLPVVGRLSFTAVSAIGGFLVFTVFALINGYLLVKSGQTIGKKLLGIRIVRKNGEKAGWARILLVRELPWFLIYAVPYVGAAILVANPLAIFRKSRYCLHDDIADTKVIELR